VTRILDHGTDISEELLEAIELLLFGAIGLTSFALAQSSPADLTLHQWRALVVIGRAGTIRVGEVALQIGTALPATSRLLSRLERRGYLTSTRDEKDRRAINVRLSPSGELVRIAVIERRRQLMQDALAKHPGPLPNDLAHGLHALGKAFAPYT
jgi:DNA-binding MarR family transcriptional regulator